MFYIIKVSMVVLLMTEMEGNCNIWLGTSKSLRKALSSAIFQQTPFKIFTKTVPASLFLESTGNRWNGCFISCKQTPVWGVSKMIVLKQVLVTSDISIKSICRWQDFLTTYIFSTLPQKTIPIHMFMSRSSIVFADLSNKCDYPILSPLLPILGEINRIPY